ncbi:four helix bundle protein [Candidatus Roizmanbacteria bacterium RIFCSPLOWO2_01_FULL_37_12]|uniref:Four helix bundle protein n=1 Tax=Candidatus Roizmanbacteria bacterium RIFCSPLOWO2_01_FULL_37_12 TaxID=1802056 RepID=A0A1F7IFQ3_9BACT|nr:MAG: four helix bundle protein [Candidatus Roizmanbacteria bacterium RIFCSPLOWO2_01_FULL_37_12]
MDNQKSEVKKPIRSFRDLDVYQNTYRAMLLVMKNIVPELPDSEKYDLRDQLSRSCKSIPRLVAEGYGKRHQKAGFQKYLDDAIAECNETIVSLEQCKDLYMLHEKEINELIKIYDISGRQLYKLSKAWTNFKRPTS